MWLQPSVDFTAALASLLRYAVARLARLSFPRAGPQEPVCPFWLEIMFRKSGHDLVKGRRCILQPEGLPEYLGPSAGPATGPGISRTTKWEGQGGRVAALIGGTGAEGPLPPGPRTSVVAQRVRGVRGRVDGWQVPWPTERGRDGRLRGQADAIDGNTRPSQGTVDIQSGSPVRRPPKSSVSGALG